MPTTPPPRRAGDLTRRTAVGGAVALGAAVVAGCTPRGIDRRAHRRPAATRSPDVDPDVALAAAVLADEQAMLDRVTATVRRHPRLAGVLAGARRGHEAHVALLTRAVPDDARTPPASPSTVSPSVAPTATPSSGGTSAAVPVVPARVPAALAALARGESRLGLLGRRSAFAAQSGAFARVLASMAAAAAQQSTTLSAAALEDR